MINKIFSLNGCICSIKIFVLKCWPSTVNNQQKMLMVNKYISIFNQLFFINNICWWSTKLFCWSSTNAVDRQHILFIVDSQHLSENNSVDHQQILLIVDRWWSTFQGITICWCHQKYFHSNVDRQRSTINKTCWWSTKIFSLKCWSSTVNNQQNLLMVNKNIFNKMLTINTILSPT